MPLLHMTRSDMISRSFVRGQFAGYYYGTTSRGVANHSKAIGWKPVKTTADMLASIEPEVDAILAQKSA